MAAVRTASRHEAYSIRVNFPSALCVVDIAAGQDESKKPDNTSSEVEFRALRLKLSLFGRQQQSRFESPSRI